MPTFTTQLKDLLDAVNSLDGFKPDEWQQVLPLFRTACAAHKGVTAVDSQGYYLHIGVFLSNDLKFLDTPPHPLVQSPEYTTMFTHDAIGSNLGNFSGIEFVHSGHPPGRN